MLKTSCQSSASLPQTDLRWYTQHSALWSWQVLAVRTADCGRVPFAMMGFIDIDGSQINRQCRLTELFTRTEGWEFTDTILVGNNKTIVQ